MKRPPTKRALLFSQKTKGTAPVDSPSLQNHCKSLSRYPHGRCEYTIISNLCENKFANDVENSIYCKKFLTMMREDRLKTNLKEFNKIPMGEHFRMGVFSDSPTGLYMTSEDHNKLIKFVAVKGGADDWAVYVGNIEDSYQQVALNGLKITSEDNIMRAVPCTDDVLRRYRK